MSEVLKMEMNETFTVEGINDYTSQSDEFVESYLMENKISVDVTPKMKSLLTTLEGLQKIVKKTNFEYCDGVDLDRLEDQLFDQLRDEIRTNIKISFSGSF